MLVTAGLVVLGGVALLSMVMMIGNVLTKSPYGKTWALLGGLSVLLAGGLVVLRILVPSVETIGTAEAESMENEQHQGSTEQVDVEEELTTDDEDESEDSSTDAEATGTEATGTETTGAASTDSNPLSDLSVLSNIMDLLKQGKPLPPEYLSLLPEGAPGVVAQQSKAEPVAISKPLQTQLVSLNRSQGTTYQPSKSYVPTTKPKSTTDKATTAPNSNAQTDNTNSTSNSQTNPTSNTAEPSVPAPQRPPVTPQTPTSQPEPPASTQPPVSTAAALLDGGLTKSVIGRSKADVQAYFKYNQFLGQEGNTFRYLRGASIVEVTFTDSDIAQQMLLRFDRFTPQGKSMEYYEDYMRSVSGVTKANASSRSGNNIYWNGVYPGVSALQFHIDTGANYGYVKATY